LIDFEQSHLQYILSKVKVVFAIAIAYKGL